MPSLLCNEHSVFSLLSWLPETFLRLLCPQKTNWSAWPSVGTVGTKQYCFQTEAGALFQVCEKSCKPTFPGALASTKGIIFMCSLTERLFAGDRPPAFSLTLFQQCIHCQLRLLPQLLRNTREQETT